MKPTHILCHYAEIGLKGQNRIFFENKLKSNLKTCLKNDCPASIDSIKHLRGRLLISLTEKGRDSLPTIIESLKNVFGLAYFAPAVKSDPDLDILTKKAVRLLSESDFDTFRITTRKTYSNVDFSSQKANEIIGAAVVNQLNKRVNLNHPEANCHIDLIQSRAYLYIQKIPGPGGLPVGSSGKVVVMLSGGIDSPVAAYYIMKRGARSVFVHFHALPHVSPASIEKVRSMVTVLNKYQFRSKLILVPFAPIQDEILVRSDPRYRVILYRRFMLRISERIAQRESAKAIVTGESLGQVASQTLENIGVVGRVTSLPILRPLIGSDKQEIIARAREIGTYDISILPHQDCCTLYVPRHPITKARLRDVEFCEENLTLTDLVDHAMNNIEVEFVGP